MNNRQTKLHAAQFDALKKRLAQGRPLTAAQMEFVEDYTNALSSPESSGSPSGSDLVPNASELARRLGVSRQVISYHRTRTGAPQTFSVRAWTDYLIAHGKSVADKVSADASSAKDSHSDPPACWTTIHFFDDLTATMRATIATAAKQAKVRINDEQLDLMTLEVWQATMETLDASLVRQGRERYLVSRDDAEFEDPSPHREIAKIMLRQDARNRESKSRSKRKRKSSSPQP